MTSHGPHAGIIVGVDGSQSALAAIRWAVREAMMRNVPLTLVSVVALPLAEPGAFGWPKAPNPFELRQWYEEDTRAMVADAIKVVEDLVGDGHLAGTNHELIFGRPVPTLAEASKGAQMAVVGYRGQNTLRWDLLGSVGSGLVQHAHCPVAVIHEDAAVSREPSRLPVVVGIDGSPASELATAIAFDEASRRGVELVALHAWSDVEMTSVKSMEWSALQAGAEEILAERLAGFQERYPDVPVRRLIVCDHPARHILDHSKAAQLVVVGSHGRGGFAGMLLGSVSRAVVHAARTPVIVARQR